MYIFGARCISVFLVAVVQFLGMITNMCCIPHSILLQKIITMTMDGLNNAVDAYLSIFVIGTNEYKVLITCTIN